MIIGIDFLQQTQLAFDKNGIHLCCKFDDDLLVNIVTVFDETISVVKLSQSVNCEEAKDSECLKLKEAKGRNRMFEKVKSLSERREKEIKVRE
ncbi:hypothetical protein TNCT_176381 [Trichonephila clavata]|uniref:Uncharacterized protein n=1 Tax=Trichonephila clavata TaxID=2740835 RepID=A0A8X6HX09_TRICU|nr:hypothetical protein TNCT_176381 [Trichonephila clavata]